MEVDIVDTVVLGAINENVRLINKVRSQFLLVYIIVVSTANADVITTLQNLLKRIGIGAIQIAGVS